MLLQFIYHFFQKWKLPINRVALDYQVSARTTLPGFSKGAEYYQKFQTLCNFCVIMITKRD